MNNLYEESKAQLILKIKLSTLMDFDSFGDRGFQETIELKIADLLKFILPDCEPVVLAKLAGYNTGFVAARVEPKEGEEPLVIFEGIEAVVLAIPRKQDDKPKS